MSSASNASPPRQRSACVLAFFLCLLAFERPVHAYLDPGSGSMVLQVLLGGVAAAGVVLRLYWNRFRDWLARKPAEAKGDTNGQVRRHDRQA